ncbi:unnamed protein product [Ambrosiozyma monospora]|uniref:Unnamed protein product n=1 Tax=Ambrosiozyma monospora TaxID=43982 RepID=A0ACB5TUQ4_AMBMO|nr:unnamed protein product [Ambrosiozyma monospora]
MTNIQEKPNLGAAPGAWNQVEVEKCHPDSKILGVDILPYDPPSGVSTMQANILSKQTHRLIRDFFRKSDQERELKAARTMDIQSSSGGTIASITNESLVASELENDSDERSESHNSNKGTKEKTIKSVEEIEAERENERPIDVVVSDMYEPFLQVSGYHSRTTNLPYFRMANMTGLALKDHLASMDLCDAALIVCCDLLRKNGKCIMKFFTGEEDKNLEKRLSVVFRKVYRFKPKATRPESKECYFICLGKRHDIVNKMDVFKVA